MATTRLEALLQDALTLTAEERAHLASDLIASLDEGEDPDAEEAWAVELERRAERAHSGQSKGTDWKTVRAEAEKQLRGK